MRNFFLAGNRLRSGWRILVFLVVTFPPLYFLTMFFWEELLLRYFILFWLLLVLSFLAAKHLDKRPIGTIGFQIHVRSVREYFLGFAMGFVLVSVLFFTKLAFGYIEVSLNVLTVSLVKSILLFSLLKTLFQSAFEELFFRGYILQNLIEGTNTAAAVAIPSILFGLGHLLTPNASWIVAINLSVFGAMHAVGYVKTKSLFLPSGLHFSWNFFMRDIYSLPVSGTEASFSLLRVTEKGPGLFTGGKYGPEAGIPALLLMIICSCVICFWRRITVAPEMKALWERCRQDVAPR
jgi:membrane protease YdiL (CAAX protease family)